MKQCAFQSESNIHQSDHANTDFDDRITQEEIIDFIHRKELPIEDSVVDEMFKDAVKGRGFVNEA